MAEKDDKAAGADAKAAKSGGSGVMSWIIPSLLAVAGSWAGSHFGKQAPASAAVTEEAKSEKKEAGPTERTLRLDPFLMSIGEREIHSTKPHVAKLTMAVEFAEEKAEEKKKGGEGEGAKDPYLVFVPRIRDAVQSYFATLKFEDMLDFNEEKRDKIKADLVERFKKAGVESAQHVLITDFVLQ